MSILIAMPCYGGNVSEQTAMSLYRLAKIFQKQEIKNGLLTIANGSLITQTRSEIANFFINNTNYDYLFFLDSDIGFDPNFVIRLMNHKKDIVCGYYPKKIIPKQYSFVISQPEKKCGNLIKIDGNGLGFTLINRKVFLDISKKYPDLKYFPDKRNSDHKISEKEYNNSYHYFLEQKKESSFLSEDMSFFYRASSVGYECWMDMSIELKHIGSHIFN